MDILALLIVCCVTGVRVYALNRSGCVPFVWSEAESISTGEQNQWVFKQQDKESLKTNFSHQHLEHFKRPLTPTLYQIQAGKLENHAKIKGLQFYNDHKLSELLRISYLQFHKEFFLKKSENLDCDTKILSSCAILRLSSMPCKHAKILW